MPRGGKETMKRRAFHGDESFEVDRKMDLIYAEILVSSVSGT